MHDTQIFYLRVGTIRLSVEPHKKGISSIAAVAIGVSSPTLMS
jgi:hypothetical protein